MNYKTDKEEIEQAKSFYDYTLSEQVLKIQIEEEKIHTGHNRDHNKSKVEQGFKEVDSQVDALKQMAIENRVSQINIHKERIGDNFYLQGRP